MLPQVAFGDRLTDYVGFQINLVSKRLAHLVAMFVMCWSEHKMLLLPLVYILTVRVRFLVISNKKSGSKGKDEFNDIKMAVNSLYDLSNISRKSYTFIFKD